MLYMLHILKKLYDLHYKHDDKQVENIYFTSNF